MLISNRRCSPSLPVSAPRLTHVVRPSVAAVPAEALPDLVLDRFNRCSVQSRRSAPSGCGCAPVFATVLATALPTPAAAWLGAAGTPAISDEQQA